MATTPHARSSLKRTACDRCRRSKLRCLRDENQEKCTRCLRLDLYCSVAPAKPPGRPRKATASKPARGDLVADTNGSSIQLIEQESHGAADAANTPCSIPPSQNPYSLLPGLDDFAQVNSLFNETQSLPSLPQSDINDLDLNLTLPFSDLRTPEWNEVNRLNPGSPPSRDPLEVHSLFTAKLDRHECLKELSQLNVDLHSHWKALQELDESGKVNFVTFVDHPPPPAGDGVSLAEKFLIMAQRFQQAITNLIWVVKHEPESLYQPGRVVSDDGTAADSWPYVAHPLSAPPPPPPPREESHQAALGDILAEQYALLITPFACVLVSCYVQMINLWEVMFFHAHRRAIGVDRSPLNLSDPSKGIQLGAFYMFSGRLASMFYCQTVLYFLDNIDRGLGILPDQRQQGVSGLISHPRHFDMLQKELGGGLIEGVNERVWTLKDTVEKARLQSVNEAGI
ncbi:hypothetical protein F5Y11DRAFT_25637 [Daldinia sp. FL1419]|nr:hypothetical protein F5Y11DRAFT_25637 [Daldinia sp. FL1419]